MVRFIKQEADEKANEIAVSAEEVKGHCPHLLGKHFAKCNVISGS